MLTDRATVYECAACHGRSKPGQGFGAIVHLYGCPVEREGLFRLGSYPDGAEVVESVGDLAAALRAEREGFCAPPWAGGR